MKTTNALCAEACACTITIVSSVAIRTLGSRFACCTRYSPSFTLTASICFALLACCASGPNAREV